MSGDRIRIVLGPEWDDKLRTRLGDVLRGLAAVQTSSSWSPGGGGELETVEFSLGDQVLEVESETYIGLSIAGPRELVEKIKALM